MSSLGIISCKNKVLKYSNHAIIFYENGHVYKQYPLNQYRWINEVFIVNSLSHPNIIKFEKCEILTDNIIDAKNKEICLDKTEKVMRITMNKYKSSLNQIKTFSDANILYIINALISANIYCNSKQILHRDIKESNILINYTATEKTTHITDIVLTDFGISKYKYNISAICGTDVITVSHRPPELYGEKKLEYDERIDVWSFCIVLTYLLTGKSLYAFLLKGYTGICDDILSKITKLKIAITHFLKIYTNKQLIHLELYKKILKHGLTSYEKRYTFQGISKICETYALAHKLNYSTIIYTNIETPCTPKHLQIKWIQGMHEILQNPDCVYDMFIKVLNNHQKTSVVDELHMLSIYIMVCYLLHDFPVIIDKYIQTAKYCIPTAKHKMLTVEKIEYTIANISEVNSHCIIPGM
jgi:serine/threonine protein kinase